jgi:hypothetical protein
MINRTSTGHVLLLAAGFAVAPATAAAGSYLVAPETPGPRFEYNFRRPTSAFIHNSYQRSALTEDCSGYNNDRAGGIVVDNTTAGFRLGTPAVNHAVTLCVPTLSGEPRAAAPSSARRPIRNAVAVVGADNKPTASYRFSQTVLDHEVQAVSDRTLQSRWYPRLLTQDSARRCGSRDRSISLGKASNYPTQRDAVGRQVDLTGPWPAGSVELKNRRSGNRVFYV